VDTILLVDDEDALRDLIAEALADVGYRVESVADGVEAIAWLGRFRPQVVLLDRHLRVMSGDEVLRWMPTQEHLRGVPVLIMSALDVGPLPPGAAGTLKKPFNLDELFSAVASFAPRPVAARDALGAGFT
jgi:DNA-binding response OmpR family regulator